MALQYSVFKANTRLNQASPVLKRGESGGAVKLIQTALIDLGYKMPLTVKTAGLPDGIYGRETEKTVKQFQIDLKISDHEGIVGKDTITKLDELMFAKHKPTAPVVAVMPKVAKFISPKSLEYKVGRTDPMLKADKSAGKWNSKPSTWTSQTQRALTFM